MSAHKTSDYDAFGGRLEQLSAGICVLRLAVEFGGLDQVRMVAHLSALEDAAESLRDEHIALCTDAGAPSCRDV